MSERNGHSNGHHGPSSNGHGPGRPSGEAAQTRWQVRVIVPGLPLQACSVLLSRMGAGGPQHVLVDTCFPQHDMLLVDGLRRAGLKPEDIEGVICTHFHLDHCGGNFLFPRAWVFGSRRDFDWAISIYESVCSGETRREVFRTFYPEATEAEFERMDEARVLQLLRWMWDPASLGDTGRYRWMEEQALGLPGVQVVPTPGHTPGHISIAVEGVEDRYLILGDARSFADDGQLGYDMPPHNQAQYRASRELVDRFAGILMPGHDDPFSQSSADAEAPAAAFALASKLNP